jgi:hypothetical protein
VRRTLKLNKEHLTELASEELGELVGGTVRPVVIEKPTYNIVCTHTLLNQWSCNQLCVTPTIRC